MQSANPWWTVRCVSDLLRNRPADGQTGSHSSEQSHGSEAQKAEIEVRWRQGRSDESTVGSDSVMCCAGLEHLFCIYSGKNCAEIVS